MFSLRIELLRAIENNPGEHYEEDRLCSRSTAGNRFDQSAGFEMRYSEEDALDSIPPVDDSFFAIPSNTSSTQGLENSGDPADDSHLDKMSTEVGTGNSRNRNSERSSSASSADSLSGGTFDVPRGHHLKFVKS